jgi:hypothetical protein
MISNLIDSLFGCSHKRITFPITIKHAQRAKTEAPAGTYVVCLDCGGEFDYDWKLMKILGRRDLVATVPEAAPAEAVTAKAA